MDKQNIGVGERIARVEVDVDGVKREVFDLNQRFDVFARGVHEEMRALSVAMSSGLKELTVQVTAGRQTNWGVIFAGLGVLVTVMSTVGFLALSPMKTSIEDLKFTTRGTATRLEVEEIYRRIERIEDRQVRALEQK